jgi:hypothetical protein
MPGLEALTHDGCPRWPGETCGRSFHATVSTGLVAAALAGLLARFERSATVSLMDHDEFGVLVVGGGITRSPESATAKPHKALARQRALRDRGDTLRSMDLRGDQSDHGKVCRQGDDQCRGRGQGDQSRSDQDGTTPNS